MHFAVLVSYLATAWLVVAVGVLFFTCACTLLQPRIQARRATGKERPPVSAILPIKLRHSGFEAAQVSIFAQDYPQYEVLFSAAESDSSALDVAQELKCAHPAIASRILRSQSDFAVSPKLNTLTAPLSAAAYDFVLVKDSNIILEPDMISVFLQNYTPDIGLVVGVPVAEQPENLAGHVEACIINAHARLLLTASALGFGFGVGKVMLFQRSDLARAGGVDAMAYTLAEDTAISKGLEAIGLKTAFAHRTLRQLIGSRTFRDIYDRQVRWGVIRRMHEPLIFPLEPFASPLPAAFAAALAAPLFGLSAVAALPATLLGWFLCEIGVAWLKGWDVALQSPLAFIGREVLTLAAWLRAWTTYDVVWADGRFDVFVGAREVSSSELSPHGDGGRRSKKSARGSKNHLANPVKGTAALTAANAPLAAPTDTASRRRYPTRVR